MITLTEAEQRVELGAYFLDLVLPEWRDEINIRTLDVRSGRWCLLGQCFGSYALGASALALGDETLDLGFSATESADYDVLTRAWARELAGV